MAVQDTTRVTTSEDKSFRRTLGKYASYADAQRTVDYLSDEGFPVENVAIVGTELRYEEQITGRATVATQALQGLGQGMFCGVFFALFFGLFFAGPAFFGLLVYGLVLGGTFGAIFGAVGQAATRGTRDFTSIAHTRPERYEVQASEHVADRASGLLNARK